MKTQAEYLMQLMAWFRVAFEVAKRQTPHLKRSLHQKIAAIAAVEKLREETRRNINAMYAMREFLKAHEQECDPHFFSDRIAQDWERKYCCKCGMAEGE